MVLCFQSKCVQSLPDPIRVRVAVTASSTFPATPLMTAQTSTDAMSSDTVSEESCVSIDSCSVHERTVILMKGAVQS